MSKQEEIRQVIDIYVDDVCLYPDTGCMSESVHRDFPGYCDSTEGAYRCLLKRLGELGVMLMVEREFPEHILPDTDNVAMATYAQGYLNGQTTMLEAGYVAMMPLVDKEEK